MGEYTGLAEIYDKLMAGMDYADWADYVLALADRHGGVAEKTALDLACGTGSTTLALARRGFHVTGLDLSASMLALAARKARHESMRVDFLQADMRDFTLPGEVMLVVTFQDGLNYLLDEEDLQQTVKSVNSVLNPGGLFIFDINRIEKLPRPGEEISFLESEDFTLIYKTSFVKKDMWEIAVTGFVPVEGGLFSRFHEVHRERAISPSEVRSVLADAGFVLSAEYAGFSLEPPDEDTRRVFYVAKKEG